MKITLILGVLLNLFHANLSMASNSSPLKITGPDAKNLFEIIASNEKSFNRDSEAKKFEVKLGVFNCLYTDVNSEGWMFDAFCSTGSFGSSEAKVLLNPLLLVRAISKYGHEIPTTGTIHYEIKSLHCTFTRKNKKYVCELVEND